ncbi:50S ribosomal protein L4 [Paracoccus sp. (in: a-proteobacteria)]|uniref:50S ribosomal protein L4 n=1 Tax=Paracoccus sp. TaxID=267 RepID=UPI003A4C66A1
MPRLKPLRTQRSKHPRPTAHRVPDHEGQGSDPRWLQGWRRHRPQRRRLRRRCACGHPAPRCPPGSSRSALAGAPPAPPLSDASEVARTGKKFGRQKGGGTARHGDRKAPIFILGGGFEGARPAGPHLRPFAGTRRSAPSA